METANSTTPEANTNNKTSQFLNYLKDSFVWKICLKRLIFFAIGFVIAFVPAITFNVLFRKGELEWINDFDNEHYHNWGMAFGNHSIPTWAIYLLQTLIVVFLLVALLFSNQWYFSLFLSIALVGGVFNLVDRAVGYPGWPNSVIDYIDTTWFFDTISNYPDFCIVGGVIGYIISMLVSLIMTSAKKKQEDDQNPGSQQ